MSRFPKTRAEAESTRYGKWAGHPTGNPYRPEWCAMHTQTGGRGSLPTQCGSKPGHGPDGLYCKHHALEVDPPASFTAWQVNTYYSHGIEEIQVIHATEKMVTLKGGRKQARDTQYYRVFDTRDEAVTFARNRAEAEIRGAEQTIKVAQKFIKSLEP